MAYDKVVDSQQLDADLVSVANAIRTRGGTSAQLAFPADFVSAVQAIPSGEAGYGEDIIFLPGYHAKFTTLFTRSVITTNDYTKPQSSGNTGAVLYTTDPIDLTGYSTLKLTLYIDGTLSGRSFANTVTTPGVGVGRSAPTVNKSSGLVSGWDKYIKISTGENVTATEVTLDISDLSGEYYIGVSYCGTGGYDGYLNIASLVLS